MSTVRVTLTDGTVHDFDVERLTREQVFHAVQSGRMDMEMFDEWVSAQRADAYDDGAANQSEAMSY